MVQVNPAGALDGHLRVVVAFKVCPSVDGMVDMRRKHIELKHFLISRLSSKTEAELETHRVENLRREGVALTVEKVLLGSRVIDVRFTKFENGVS